MAGHSQFKNIMHRKGKQDAQKSKLFGKLAREITVAAGACGTLASAAGAAASGTCFLNKTECHGVS